MLKACSLLKFLLLFLFCVQIAQAQYFGRNKPRYSNFDFKILKTDHFDIYYYDLDSSRIAQIGEWFEVWYDRHSRTFGDIFVRNNPVILYNNHSDFQQTFAIQGNIDVGTGGVTEGLRNRVVLPLALTNEQTFHVIGHELVHAFQYETILKGDSTSIESFQFFPLWMIEGMAEYLSIGSKDAHTSMWMRDAYMNHNIPELDKMDRPQYFPYRFGQAFWAYFGGSYGDSLIKPFFLEVAKRGLTFATEDVLHISADSLSKKWQQTLSEHYKRQVATSAKDVPGRKIVDDKNSGEINISPTLSPNGKYIAFLSEKDLFTTDLYLADANSGKILRKLYSATKEGHIDQLNSIESAGSWSPDSKEIAFSAFKGGHSVLLIKKAENGKTSKEISIAKLPFFAHPAWSPDGKSIILSGMVNGQTDLFQYIFKTKELHRLTDDPYSEIQADWSKDGSKIVFATDELSMNDAKLGNQWLHNIAIMDMKTSSKRLVQIFRESNNLNPQFINDNDLVFLSDNDGYRNMYRYNMETEKVDKLTQVATGITNITPYGPAISISSNRDKIIYSYYSDNSYQIYQVLEDKIKPLEIKPNEQKKGADELPVFNAAAPGLVNALVHSPRTIDSSTQVQITPYKSKFRLSYIGAASGIGYGNQIGQSSAIGAAGGIDLLFNDILGNHQLYTGLAMNGDFIDVAGAVTYINYSNRLPWGLTTSHTPSRFVNYTQAHEFKRYVDEDGNEFTALADTTDLLRIFEDQLGVFVQYPLSITKRLEAGAGLSYRFFRYDQIVEYYGDYNRFTYYGESRTKLPTGDQIQLGPYTISKGFLYNLSTAFVGDNSYFGMCSPLAGYRYRFGLDQYFGQYQFSSLTLDARKYFWIKPISLALRALHFARFGQDALNFYPTLLGQYGLMHGFGYSQLDKLRTRYGIEYEQISGANIALGSVEIRLPLLGPKKLSLLTFPYLPTELNLFVDGGIAWDKYSDFSEEIDFFKPLPVFSTGVGLRFNLFGALIIEPYAAWPLIENTQVTYGLNLLPGW